MSIWKEISPNEWKEIAGHTCHEFSVNSVAWAPWEFGLRLAACSSDGYISFISRRGGMIKTIFLMLFTMKILFHYICCTSILRKKYMFLKKCIYSFYIIIPFYYFFGLLFKYLRRWNLGQSSKVFSARRRSKFNSVGTRDRNWWNQCIANMNEQIS